MSSTPTRTAGDFQVAILKTRPENPLSYCCSFEISLTALAELAQSADPRNFDCLLFADKPLGRWYASSSPLQKGNLRQRLTTSVLWSETCFQWTNFSHLLAELNADPIQMIVKSAEKHEKHWEKLLITDNLFGVFFCWLLFFPQYILRYSIFCAFVKHCLHWKSPETASLAVMK